MSATVPNDHSTLSENQCAVDESHAAEEQLLDCAFTLAEEVRASSDRGHLVTLPRDCWDDISVIKGEQGTYLYCNRTISDSYAHLLALNEEADDFATFLDRVRGESKLYPRPLKATSLTTPPLNLTLERVRELYEKACETDGCADIHLVRASNGDEYFFSDRYLSEPLARRSAERRSVERFDRL